MIDQNWLSFPSLLAAVSLLTLAVIIKYYIPKRKYFHLGSKLPGPKPLPFVGNGLEFLNEEDVFGILNKINEKHPFAAIWFGPSLEISISRPEDMEICLTSPKCMDFGEIARFLEPALGQGLLIANGAQWKKMRKISAPAFHPIVTRSFAKIFHERSNVLVNLLEKEVGKSSFNIYPYIKKCSFDFISETSFGVKYNAQECQLEFLTAADRLEELITSRIFTIWQHPDFLYKLTKDGKEHDRKVKIVYQFVDQIIELAKKNYLEEMKKSEDFSGASNETSLKRNIFINQLLQFDDCLNVQELRENVTSIIVAGYDTTSTTASFALVTLAMHPEIQEKAYQEVKSVFDNLIDQEMNDDDLCKLEYLDRIIKEILRLFPPAPIIPRKAMDDIYMGDYLIPKGAGINMNFYVLHRNPKQFKDPLKFDPDRFLPENEKNRHPFAYAPFSGGRRKCPGAEFASKAVRAMVGNILYKYKVECDYTSVADLEVRFYASLKMKGGYFMVRLLKR